jgi:hypothetical protein
MPSASVRIDATSANERSTGPCTPCVTRPDQAVDLAEAVAMLGPAAALEHHPRDVIGLHSFCCAHANSGIALDGVVVIRRRVDPEQCRRIHRRGAHSRHIALVEFDHVDGCPHRLIESRGVA